MSLYITSSLIYSVFLVSYLQHFLLCLIQSHHPIHQGHKSKNATVNIVRKMPYQGMDLEMEFKSHRGPWRQNSSDGNCLPLRLVQSHQSYDLEEQEQNEGKCSRMCIAEDTETKENLKMVHFRYVATSNQLKTKHGRIFHWVPWLSRSKP